TNVVAFTYDNANRRATLTLPNGIVVTHGYPPPLDKYSKDARKKCERAIRDCSPCKPPVGTISYRIDRTGRPDQGIPTPHWHLYVMQQSPPEKGCKCQWVDIDKWPGGIGPGTKPPSGTVPIGEPAGGGPRILLAGGF